VVAICDHLANLKYSKGLPLAFTEHGAIMAASVLNSRRAVEVSVFVVRAFLRLRRVLEEHREIAKKIEHLERRLADHDAEILNLVKAINQLMSPAPLPPKRRIGFRSES
jgi:hypothetical protein